MPTQSEIDSKKAAGSTAYVKIPFENKHYIPYAASASNTAISINSKHPERAMQLIGLMNTEKGKDLYNLLVFGIEGEHYTKVNDKEIQPIGYTSQPTSEAHTDNTDLRWVTHLTVMKSICKTRIQYTITSLLRV